MSAGKSQKIISITGNNRNKPIVYLLHGEDGDMLIDTGMRRMTAQLDRWIKRNDFKIKYVFLTHGHWDHTYNARFLKQRYGAEIILHEKDKSLLAEGEKHYFFAIQEDKEELVNYYRERDKWETAPYCKVDHLITDDDTDYLRKLGFDADIVMLPGHTAGSMGILQGRVLYCGDACSAIGGDYFTIAFGELDPEITLQSEFKIFELNPLIIAPGHGRIIINEKAFPAK